MSEPGRSKEQIVACPDCGAKNRLASERQTAEPVCGRCRTPLLRQTRPLTVTDRNFSEQVLASPLPVLLDMWAPWCGPCRALGPVVDELAREMSGRARVGKLNVDENPLTASRFQVQSIPTLLVIKNGAEVDRLLGALPKDAIRRRLEKHL